MTKLEEVARAPEPTNHEARLMFGMLMNGSAIGLGLHRREEFANLEKNGWLSYDDRTILGTMRLTEAGRKAVANWQRALNT